MFSAILSYFQGHHILSTRHDAEDVTLTNNNTAQGFRNDFEGLSLGSVVLVHVKCYISVCMLSTTDFFLVLISILRGIINNSYLMIIFH